MMQQHYSSTMTLPPAAMGGGNSRVLPYHHHPAKVTATSYSETDGGAWQLRQAPMPTRLPMAASPAPSYVQQSGVIGVGYHDQLLTSPTMNTRTRVGEPISRYGPMESSYTHVNDHTTNTTHHFGASSPPLRHLGPSISSGPTRVVMQPTAYTSDGGYNFVRSSGNGPTHTISASTHLGPSVHNMGPSVHNMGPSVHTMGPSVHNLGHMSTQMGASHHLSPMPPMGGAASTTGNQVNQSSSHATAHSSNVMQGHLRPLAAPTDGGMQAPAGVEYIVAPPSARDAVSYKRTHPPPTTTYAAAQSETGGELLMRGGEEAPQYSDEDKIMHPDNCTPIAVGRKLPPAHIDLHGVCVNLQDFFEDRCGIIFGLVGAFCPGDTDRAVPQILKSMESFERLVDFVGCLVVNDPFVVKAWAKSLGVTDQFTFIADSDAKFTKVLGMVQYLPNEGLGIRSRRFAVIVGPRARVRWVGFEEDSLAENVLATLPRFVRTPWKSFLAGIGYSKSDSSDPEAIKEDARIKEETVSTMQSMRSLLKNQGFCSEQDWQLVLCDKMSQVFTPTKDNILNGLRWLVEGAQAGDVLCFYFAGKGGCYVNKDNVESVGLLPMDYEESGPIGEWEIYDILAPHVPECCRLTIILDIHNEHSVTCPLPYVYNSEVTMVPSGFMETQIVKGNNKQWLQQFGSSMKLAGELVVITLVGNAKVPHGCLASLLNTVCASSDEKRESTEGGATPEPPLSFADQMDRMQIQLVEWGAEKSVQISTSRPLNLMEEFSLSDVLP